MFILLLPAKVWKTPKEKSNTNSESGRRRLDVSSLRVTSTSCWDCCVCRRSKGRGALIDMCGPLCWQGFETDPHGFIKLMWYDFVRECDCKAISIWSSCADRKEMAHTHRQRGLWEDTFAAYIYWARSLIFVIRSFAAMRRYAGTTIPFTRSRKKRMRRDGVKDLLKRALHATSLCAGLGRSPRPMVNATL